ncbi:MAG: electron transfer flavoprotein subunit alpha/FixB family protein [Chloroflexi bacterium]|nr:electron transfer flavoprotein subunit alpha/FixB family protein [Chloroflexota bacterium]
MADYTGVMIVGEVVEGKLAAITTELLGAGRKLADDLGEKLSAVLIGSGISALAQEAIASGADKVFVVDDPLLKDYQSDAFIAVVEKIVRESLPQIVLLGQTAIGRDVTPRLAFRLKTAASMDCLKLEIDPATRKLLQTKPVYGGNAQAVFTTDAYPQIATLRVKAATPLQRDPSRQGEIINFAAGLSPEVMKTRSLEKVPEKAEGIKLEDAQILVVGGRGIGGPEGFAQLRELANLLKGAVGASRPPCDNGWVPPGLQIGLTGKVVAPDVYIAIGLSGTSQHMSGCSGAKHIIAINKDPEANVFKVAQYGVVGDWKKVLPAFTQKLKELLAG